VEVLARVAAKILLHFLERATDNRWASAAQGTGFHAAHQKMQKIAAEDRKKLLIIF